LIFSLFPFSRLVISGLKFRLISRRTGIKELISQMKQSLVNTGHPVSATVVVTNITRTGKPPLFLLALYFNDFRRREAEIHCADNAIRLFWIASANYSAGYRRVS
jgi:hypothetical protein